MNDFTAFVYLAFLVGILGATFAFMWKMTTSTLKEMDKPNINIHPEMKDVRSGESLLVFKSKKDENDGGDEEIIIVRK